MIQIGENIEHTDDPDEVRKLLRNHFGL
jgi:hypothetical protein